MLAVSDLRIRYGRGGLRAVKWFLDPFAALGVYLVLVTAGARHRLEASRASASPARSSRSSS